MTKAGRCPQLPPDPVPRQQPIKQPNLMNAANGHLLQVNGCQSLPSLSGRQTREVLMRPHLVVEPAALVQSPLQRHCSRDLQSLEPVFQSAKEPLHAPVAPGRSGGNALLANPGAAQEGPEPAAVEHRLVVGSQGARYAVLSHRQTQVPEQGPTVSLAQALEPQAQARTVVDQTQQSMALAHRVGEETQIGGPSVVGLNLNRQPVVHIPSQTGQLVPVALDQVVYKALAHRHPRSCMQPVETPRHRAAPQARPQQGSQSQHLAAHPVGFLAGAELQRFGWGDRAAADCWGSTAPPDKAPTWDTVAAHEAR